MPALRVQIPQVLTVNDGTFSALEFQHLVEILPQIGPGIERLDLARNRILGSQVESPLRKRVDGASNPQGILIR